MLWLCSALLVKSLWIKVTKCKCLKIEWTKVKKKIDFNFVLYFRFNPIPPSHSESLSNTNTHLCCSSGPTWVNRMGPTGPYRFWRRRGNGTLSQKECCWLCMCGWRGGPLCSSIPWCWTRAPPLRSTSGCPAPRLGTGPMREQLCRRLFARSPLARGFWAHLETHFGGNIE